MSNSTKSNNFKSFVFNPDEPNCVQVLTRHLKSALNKKVTQKDNTGLIANAILNGQTTTNEKNGMVVKFSFDLTENPQILEDLFKAKVESSLTDGGDMFSPDLKLQSTTTWSTDRTKLFVSTAYATNDKTLFDEISQKASEIQTLDLHRVILKSGEDPPEDWRTDAINITTQHTESQRVTKDSYKAGQAKISSVLDDMLTEDIFSEITTTYENLVENGLADSNHEGTRKLQILNELYGSKALQSGDMDDSLTLMKFLNTDTQGTLDDFITRISANARNVNQKQWSLLELKLMKVYAQIQNHQEELAPGIILKLDEVSTKIETKQKAGESISVEEIKGWINQERKKQTATLKINANSVSRRGAFYTEAQIEAIRKKAAKKGAKRKNQKGDGKDDSNKKQKKFVRREIPEGKGFSKDARWCPNCEKADKKEGNGFGGFNDPDVKITGRIPHRYSLCTRKEPKD